MIDDIGYDTFFKDCDEVFKDFLAGYGFEDIGGDEEDYEKFYKSKFWILEINMLCNFPHIGVLLMIIIRLGIIFLIIFQKQPINKLRNLVTH
ncbi:hypothetical protein [Tenacibaculum sp. C7A-26P2]|uniref:hypothetical protein n=1 Tax=Tenacibaculum sp. C7A-26P2 TaxID=3447504 RepID=UPI003F84D319